MEYRRVVKDPSPAVTVSRWRKRETPIGAPSTEHSAPDYRPKWQIKMDRILEALHGDILTGTWTGSKGETYQLSCTDSKHANSGTWSCMRTGTDGLNKKFTIWYDEESEKVWWGSWTYFFDPEETSRTGVINWQKQGPGKGFEWRRQVNAETETEHVEQDVEVEVKVTVSGEITTHADEPKVDNRSSASEVKGYSLGEGVIPVASDFKFKPPPGLEKPRELQLFWEIPDGAAKTTATKLPEAADIDTSAGTTPRESETEQSEQEQVERKTTFGSKQRLRNCNKIAWRVKECSNADGEVCAPTANLGPDWQPQLWR
mmetsp:Transcript_3523/g.6214  ORF Transcript_3523/g.6214 Transcript_3523/m.6214 type:complete len:315 (+) Transcript_3523:45-989(+)